MNTNKLNTFLTKLRGKNILIQGLGLNGGGVETSLFFLRNGIDITITDLKDEKILSPSIDKLSIYNDKIHYVLGTHREKDFIDADIIVKGPGVPPANKFVQLGIENGAIITSDIDIFLTISQTDIFAVTGSKGKSTTVSIIYSIFKQKTDNAFLGGNITISPLSFYNKLNEKSLIILELSSWQLRDIKDKGHHFNGACITNLMNDHQNYYHSMEDYLNDKLIISQNQSADNFILIPYKIKYITDETINSNAKIYHYDIEDNNADFFYEGQFAFFRSGKSKIQLFPISKINIPGTHVKTNMLIAAAFSYLAHIKPTIITNGIENFKGVPYRMEVVAQHNEITFINDSASTIPEAAKAAILAYDKPIIWLAGGSDKNLDFSILEEVASIPQNILLLSGNGTDKMKKYIDTKKVIESSSLETLFEKAISLAKPGTIILFSPGCTSFGLFNNEFHRGDSFNKLVKEFCKK